MEMERAMRAELISRVWVAIAHIEELRADVLEKLPLTSPRDEVAKTLVASSTYLLAVHELLLPFEMEHVQKVRDRVLKIVNGEAEQELERLAQSGSRPERRHTSRSEPAEKRVD